MIPSPGDGWVRLSPRKLLLDPVKAVGQAVVPVVVALVGVSQSDMRWWPFFLPLAILAPLAFGAIPWLTTHYRLTETQIQVRSGLLNKTTSSPFTSTHLEFLLHSMGIEQLLVCGVASSGCVELTVRDADDKGFLVTVIGDCCAGNDPITHARALEAMNRHRMRVRSSDDIVAALAGPSRATSAPLGGGVGLR